MEYNQTMKLSKANAHLRRADKARESLWISAKSSSAIEGINKPFQNRDAVSQPSSVTELVEYWSKIRRTASVR
jgi:hypothetical protein